MSTIADHVPTSEDHVSWKGTIIQSMGNNHSASEDHHSTSGDNHPTNGDHHSTCGGALIGTRLNGCNGGISGRPMVKPTNARRAAHAKASSR